MHNFDENHPQYETYYQKERILGKCTDPFMSTLPPSSETDRKKNSKVYATTIQTLQFLLRDL